MQDFHSTAGSYLKVRAKFMFQITLLIVPFYYTVLHSMACFRPRSWSRQTPGRHPRPRWRLRIVAQILNISDARYLS
jgi:hypothetical protein